MHIAHAYARSPHELQVVRFNGIPRTVATHHSQKPTPRHANILYSFLLIFVHNAEMFK